MTKEGLLRVNGTGRRRIDPASLEEFRRRYALTKEVSEKTRVPPQRLRVVLARQGVAPVRTLSDDSLLWERDRIEAVIGTAGGNRAF